MLLVGLLAAVDLHLVSSRLRCGGATGKGFGVVRHGQSPLSAVQVCDHDRRGDRCSERRWHHNGCQGRRCEQARARTFARTFAHSLAPTHTHTQPLARAWLHSNSTAIFDDAIATAQNADVVVLVLGNDRTQVVVSAVSTASGVMRLR